MAGGAGGMPQSGAEQVGTPQFGASPAPVNTTMTDDFRGAAAPSMPFGQMVQQLGIGSGSPYSAPAPYMTPNYGSPANPQVQSNGAVYAGPMSGTPAYGSMPPQNAPSMNAVNPVTPEMLFSQMYGVQSPFAAPQRAPVSAPTQVQTTPNESGIAALQQMRQMPRQSQYRRPRMYR